jgi:GDPmannose 4,6-dehydratase
MNKVALITGINGQDGAYLSALLLEKGYEVHGMIRRASVFTTERIERFRENPHFHLHYGDMTDSSNLHHLIGAVAPDEVYNLGAQSHVAVSFEVPEYTADVDAVGTLRLLEAVRDSKKEIRVYQASTSEMFGGLPETVPQSELTPFYPKSPYGAAKLYAYWIAVNYRESFGIHVSNGILFNHESPLRGETFVTKKITMGVARQCGEDIKTPIRLGNFNAKRDWGYAKEYVEAMWLMLQQDAPSDLVIATGKSHTIHEFVEMAYRHIGVNLTWHLTETGEQGRDAHSGQLLVMSDPAYLRPSEVSHLQGDASKAERVLGWKAQTSVEQLCAIMVEHDQLRGRT